jgi:hypothetical protein
MMRLTASSTIASPPLGRQIHAANPPAAACLFGYARVSNHHEQNNLL